MMSTLSDDNEAAVKLLQHQELQLNGSSSDGHPMKERSGSNGSRVQFKEELQEMKNYNQNDFKEITNSRVRFADNC